MGHGLKAVLLFPQCAPDNQWADVPWSGEKHLLPPVPSHFMSLPIKLLQKKIQEFHPDPARIHASWLSMGGFGAWDIVSRMPDMFAGILSICGGADETQAPHLRHLTVCLYHGGEDSVVLPARSRNMVRAPEDAGCKTIRYVEVPRVKHNSWDNAFADDSALDYVFNAENPLK